METHDVFVMWGIIGYQSKIFDEYQRNHYFPEEKLLHLENMDEYYRDSRSTGHSEY